MWSIYKYIRQYLQYASCLLLVFITILPGAILDELPHNVDEVLSSSACFSNNQSTLPLLCPQHHMVKLIRVFYGHSPSGGCAQNDADCTLDLPEEENYPCVGQRECRLNLPTGSLGKWIPKCDQYATYIQAVYECIPADSVYDICEHPLLVEQTGYIKSPRYPNNYPTNLQCNLTIQTHFPDQQEIWLYIIDMDLETSTGKCMDSLHFFDTYRGFTVCGSRSKDLFMQSVKNIMMINFHSNEAERRKGFWLYYKAVPFLTTTAAPSTTPTTVPTTNATVTPLVYTTDTNSNSAATGDSRTTHLINIKYSVSAFPIGLLLGIVFGAVLCILAILLLVLVLRSRRNPQTKIPNSASKMSTSSTAAFLSDPKNNIEKAQCANIAYKHSNHDTGQKDDTFVEVTCDYRGHDLDLQSAKEIDKQVRVIENPGVLDIDAESQKPWKGPYIDKDRLTGEEHLYC